MLNKRIGPSYFTDLASLSIPPIAGTVLTERVWSEGGTYICCARRMRALGSDSAACNLVKQLQFSIIAAFVESNGFTRQQGRGYVVVDPQPDQQ